MYVLFFFAYLQPHTLKVHEAELLEVVEGALGGVTLPDAGPRRIPRDFIAFSQFLSDVYKQSWKNINMLLLAFISHEHADNRMRAEK